MFPSLSLMGKIKYPSRYPIFISLMVFSVIPLSKRYLAYSIFWVSQTLVMLHACLSDPKRSSHFLQTKADGLNIFFLIRIGSLDILLYSFNSPPFAPQDLQ